MDEKNIYRVRLMRWGDSSASGRTVTLKLPDDNGEHPFKGLPIGAKKGQMMEVEIRLLDEDGEPETIKETKKPRSTNAGQTGKAVLKHVTRGRRHAAGRTTPGAGSAADPVSTIGSDPGGALSGDSTDTGMGPGPESGTAPDTGTHPGAGGPNAGSTPSTGPGAAPDQGGDMGHSGGGGDLDAYAEQMGQAADALAAVAERMDQRDDDDGPQFPTLPQDIDDSASPGEKAMRRAADLCKAVDKQRAGFFYFMRAMYPNVPPVPNLDASWSRDARATLARLCFHCDAEALAKIADDPDIRRKFETLETDFERHERLR